MLTRPILIDVAVTPRNDAVSPTGPAEVEVDSAAAAAVVGAPAFLSLLQATTEVPTTNSTTSCVTKRERAIGPPLPAGSGSGACPPPGYRQGSGRAFPVVAHPPCLGHAQPGRSSVIRVRCTDAAPRLIRS